MAEEKIKSVTDQRPYIMVYQDFLESKVLDSPYQKLVYIYLKKYADSKDQCFPSIKTLSDITGISISKVKRTLEELEQKGVLARENRVRPDGGKSSNLYTLYDQKEVWQTECSSNVEEISEKIKEQEAIRFLRSRGFTVGKEKVPVSETDQSTDTRTNELNSVSNINTKKNECQEKERYSLEQIKEIFYYAAMVNDHPDKEKEIDSVISILHTALNTQKHRSHRCPVRLLRSLFRHHDRRRHVRHHNRQADEAGL